LAVGSSGKILHSTDGGNTWDPQTSGSTNYLYSVTMVNNNLGWIVGADGLVLKTINGGNNWSIQSVPTRNNLYTLCFTDSDNGWIAGFNGAILHTGNGNPTGLEQNYLDNANPKLYTLEQNYPNPFDIQTTIRFGIETFALVKLEIFDCLGQSVDIIIDETLNPSRYDVIWTSSGKNGKTLPPGVYFYKLSVNKSFLTKKMILFK
jgi:hypothetical protein